MEDDEYWDELPATLSTSLVAQMLELNSETVVARLKAGTIPAHRVGSSWIIFKLELRAFIESRNSQADQNASVTVDVLANFRNEMTYKDVMACLGKTKQTIYTWLREGTVPAYLIGDHWVIHTHQVRSMLQRTSNQQ